MAAVICSMVGGGMVKGLWGVRGMMERDFANCSWLIMMKCEEFGGRE
jgi:hypothetical protein